MNPELAPSIEAAEREYLRSRVENLAQVSGNPFGARVFYNGDYPCFHVGASSSPMLNRIHGDLAGDPGAVWDLLKGSAQHSTVTPLVGKPATLGPVAFIEGTRLERLKGWTHLQFVCATDTMILGRHSFDIEDATAETFALFAEVHASGFHTKPEHRALNQASFAEQAASGRLKIYVLKAGEEVVAGASMYLASNGVAYLGTAATRKSARGLGYHAALIAHRMEQAKQHGCRWVAATALAGSQSRRNLQRAGLRVSHGQALYRLGEGWSAK